MRYTHNGKLYFLRIGHLQLVITWAKDDLSRVHQYVGDYHKEGRPESCMTY